LTLRVSNVGPSIELQLLSNSSRAMTETAAITALLQVIGRSTSNTSFFDATQLLALQTVLQAQPSALSATQTGPLSRLLLPLSIGPDAHELAASLMHYLENSGIFFESKLRALLENLEDPSRPSLDALRGDLKTLLGLLSGIQSTSKAPHLSNSPAMASEQTAISRHHSPEPSPAESIVAQSKQEVLAEILAWIYRAQATVNRQS
jgi:hypothetical protein